MKKYKTSLMFSKTFLDYLEIIFTNPHLPTPLFRKPSASCNKLAAKRAREKNKVVRSQVLKIARKT